ncbi:retropepsin-like aspartic protease family protein [Sphingomonas sp. M1A8_2b]
MLKLFVLSGTILLASAGASLGMPATPSPAAKTFALAVPSLKTAANAQPSAGTSHRFARASDGLFYVNAKVNGTPIRFVVDTGSNIVVLTRRDAARARLAPAGASALALQTVGGATRMQGATVDRLEIAGQSLEHVDAATVENGLDVSLLGQSALSQLGSIRFAGDRLELN